MPRRPRIDHGAFYHVIIRGNQKQRVFKDAADHQKFLQLMTVYKNRSDCGLHAYVLMGSHAHFLIETRDVPLSRIMQGLNQTHTMYFNRRYRMVGHLYPGAMPERSAPFQCWITLRPASRSLSNS